MGFLWSGDVITITLIDELAFNRTFSLVQSVIFFAHQVTVRNEHSAKRLSESVHPSVRPSIFMLGVSIVILFPYPSYYAFLLLVIALASQLGSRS